jgi:hypothetical protein
MSALFFSAKKYAFFFLRVFVVMLSFIVDVKVRADVTMHVLNGKVDIEKEGRLIKIEKTPSKLFEPLDVQTFSHGLVKFSANSINVGLAEKSFLSLASEPHFEFYQGMGYFKSSHLLTVKTPQSDVDTDGGEFILHVTLVKTTVWVVAGSVDLKDRSSGNHQMVHSGYTTWIGGLLSQGQRARGDLQASDFDLVMNQMKYLGYYSQEELQFKYDNYRLVWKEVVEKVAQSTQNKVLDDLKTEAALEEKEQKRQIASENERAKLRRYFRAKTLGIPGESEEVPLVK